MGTATSNRDFEEFESLVGFFVNTLPLSTTIHSDQPLATVLQQVKSTVFEALDHKSLPFEKILESLEVTRDPSLSPLFQIMFVFENENANPTLSFGAGLTAGNESIEGDTVKFDLQVIIEETRNGLGIRIEYATELFDEDTIDRMEAFLESYDPKIEKELISRALEAEEDIKKGNVYSIEEADAILTRRLSS